MFRLSKAEREKIMAAATRLEEPEAALLAALAAYNEELAHLRELVRAVETNWQATWDKRSERWQESTAGQAIAEAITTWGTLADDLEEIHVEIPNIEIPESG